MMARTWAVRRTAAKSDQPGGARDRCLRHAGSPTPWTRDRMPEPCQLTLDSPVAPGRVLARHPDDQRLDRGSGGRPPWPTPTGAVPLAGDEVTVPAQDRGRGDREDLRPPAAARQPRQRREPEPVRVVPPRPTAELAAQHPGSRGAARAAPRPWTSQSEPAPPAVRTGTSSNGRRATAAPRDGASDGTDPAAKSQLTPRDRVSERDTVPAREAS